MSETPDSTASTSAAGGSRWRRVAAAAGRVARAPLVGAEFLYRAGQENMHFTLPVLNGAFGDQLAARQDSRTIQMSFRRHEADVPVADLRLTPGPTGRPQKTVVFLHGLMGDEIIWQAGSTTGPRYGPALQQDLGACCLYVRYNSGLHISENGQQLHQLLTELVRAFPAAVGELVLVGHSMGGLVIRSAGYYAEQEARSGSETATAEGPGLEPTQPASWLGHLRDVLLLGVPNDGSFLEQNSFFTSLILRKINLWPTRFVSGLIDQRSNGIKDLRHARLVEQDWQNPHADDLFPPRTVVPPLPGVHYHILVGSLLKSATSVLHEYFGDGLVGAGSAHGRIFRDPAAPPDLRISTQVYPKLHHGTLLSNPEVYAYLRDVVAQ
ncbi:alpha/beta hydrolase [Hymenobacter taeanensis]|uniref:Alpha/beta hydrolase n=1 Tax=Hymenobacter taeanensis TaxID=2735321 RepID=A0A6M6BBY9_9BACT|nr:MULTISPECIES: alpha/beta hydrolase [Hymenobacter]QJX45657.1 alpha/beta hydrolase [Hymenobacter taeanensis]UOQ79493.1 alpha/beta hydrolase [Hymenobacter sp. 5414T-23]